MLSQLLSASLLLALVPTAPQDTVKLARVYKDKAFDQFKLALTVDQANMKIKVNTDLKVTITGAPNDGVAPAMMELKETKLANADGGDMPGIGDPPQFDTKLDANAMIERLPTQQIEFVYTLFSVCSYLPTAEMKKGAEIDVNWENKSKETVRGKMKFLEITTLSGIKVAVFDSTLEVKPLDDTPGHLTAKTYLALDTGVLVKADGKVKTDDADVEFHIDLLIPVAA